MTASKSKGVVVGEGKYPLVALKDIAVVERPTQGRETEQLFYNPRDVDSFTPESMQALLNSVRTDGLQQPPLARAITENGKLTSLQLIAGERRFRILTKIVEEDLACYDDDAVAPKKYRADAIVLHRGRFGKVVSHKGEIVSIQLFDHQGEITDEIREVEYANVLPTVSGKKLYSSIPCKVVNDCTDEKALRLAFSENDNHKSLKTKEEIILVERLHRMGLKQGEISDLLGANETWVSQTLNFSEALPAETYQKLLDGKITRHVAVSFMGYKADDREDLHDEAVVVAEQDFIARSTKAEDDVITAEDEEEFAIMDQQTAESNDDEVAAKKAARQAKTARAKAEKAQKKLERVQDEKGVIKQSHVAKAAANINVSPKKSKMLPKDQVIDFYVEKMEAYIDGDVDDPECGKPIPSAMIKLVQRTAQAILDGERDPLTVIRSVMMEEHGWELMVESSEFDDDDNDNDDAEFAQVNDFGDEYEDCDEYAELESVGGYEDEDDFN